MGEEAETASESGEHRRSASSPQAPLTSEPPSVRVALSVSAALGALDERLSEWDKEVDRWREEARKLDTSLKESRAELNEVRIAETKARSDAVSFDRRLGDVQQELATVQGDLEIARAGSLVNAMTRL